MQKCLQDMKLFRPVGIYELKLIKESLRFEAKTVGSSIHKEFWIPAEELNEFNRYLIAYCIYFILSRHVKCCVRIERLKGF